MKIYPNFFFYPYSHYNYNMVYNSLINIVRKLITTVRSYLPDTRLKKFYDLTCLQKLFFISQIRK